MYNEEKLYSVRSLVVLHIVSFQQDLVVMRFIRIELIICSTTDKPHDNEISLKVQNMYHNQ